MITKLYVGHVAPTTTAESLTQTFSRYGTVSKSRVVMDRETGCSRGFAYVEMSEGADRAVQALNGSDLDGSNLAVSVAKPRKDSGLKREGS